MMKPRGPHTEPRKQQACRAQKQRQQQHDVCLCCPPFAGQANKVRISFKLPYRYGSGWIGCGCIPPWLPVPPASETLCAPRHDAFMLLLRGQVVVQEMFRCWLPQLFDWHICTTAADAHRCSWGQELCLVGSGEALGNWSVENGKRMQWTDGDVWQVDLEVNAG